MSIAILGGGAFGTALAIALSGGDEPVTLWARDPGPLRDSRQSPRLPGHLLPETVTVQPELAHAAGADILLLAVPMQQLSGLMAQLPVRPGQALVACCKGIDLTTGQGPTGLIRAAAPDSVGAVLSGPSFAADIAAGLPTALTLGCDQTAAEMLQTRISTLALRIYRSDDPSGVELGGALKNVIAIACGAAIGLGLGDSARAALLTRGFAEIQRAAPHFGARPETLTGLSGLGDLALTCTSDQSRNYRLGLALGRGTPFDPALTVEGAATARVLHRIAHGAGLDLPITAAVAGLVSGTLDADAALRSLLSRPLKEE